MANYKDEEENLNEKRITKKFLKKHLKSDPQQYYGTPSLNDFLYIHYKGFKKLENLEEFTSLKVLYAEGNCFEVIENLEFCANMRSLYL